MTIQFSTTLRNNQAGQLEGTVGTSPKLQIRTGAQPADCAAADSGSLLCEITLPSDWLGSPSNGAVAKAGTWQGTASGSGTAGHFRIKDSAGTTTHVQGSIGMGSGDLSLDNTNIAAGQTVTINSFSYTRDNA